VFEAKVLSGVSKDITFDVARDQLARLVDVMLEPPRAAARAPLSSRDPSLTSLVLVTPDLFRPSSADALDLSLTNLVYRAGPANHFTGGPCRR